MQNEYKIYVKYIHKCIHIYKNVLDKNEKKILHIYKCKSLLL